ncbi:hypothetical protein [Salinicoccus kekensis]|nr:hypothetical protein [Salinicoccus kekensis]
MFESGQTKEALLAQQEERMVPLDFVISQFYAKESDVGLTEMDEEVRTNLETQFDLVSSMYRKLEENNMDISSEIIRYVNEYETYDRYEGYIQIESMDQLAVQKEKAEIINAHGIEYIEEEMPYNSSLFALQIMNLFLNPITLLFLLLIVNFKFTSDQRNKIFEWMQLNSVSKKNISFSFLGAFVLTTIMYALIIMVVSLLPMIITGNFQTIHYPVELFTNDGTSFIAAWKLLLYIPIGWMVFAIMILYINVIFIKITQSASFAFILSVLIMGSLYIVNYNFGLQIWNPIHLLINYEIDLFVQYAFVDFLIIILILTAIIQILGFFLLKLNFSFQIKYNNNFRQSLYKPSRHFKLLSFEALRKKRNHTLSLSVAIVSILALAYYFNIDQEYHEIPEIYHEALTDYRDELIRNGAAQETLLLESELSLENAKNSGAEDSTIEEIEDATNLYSQMVDDTAYYIDEINALLENIGSADFNEEYRALFETIREDYGGYEIADETGPSVSDLSTDEMNEYFEENQIEPRPIGDTQISNFGNPNKNTEFFASADSDLHIAFYENNRDISNDTMFTVQKFFQHHIPLLLTILFVLIIWSSFSDVYKPNGVYDFIFTKPFTERMVLFSKWCFNLLSTYILLLIGAIILIAISAALGGIGSLNYPIVIYEHESLYATSTEYSTYAPLDEVFYRLDTISTVLMEASVILFLVVFFTASLHAVIGRFSKHHYVTSLVTLAVIAIGYASTLFYTEASWMWLNPFIYFDVWDVADGWQSIVVNDPRVNFANGAIILTILSVVLLIIGLISNRKRAM